MNDRLELPPLRELGPDLLMVTRRRRLLTLALPFLFCGAYFVLAEAGWWPFAVVALVALSFVTYASTSHDLVHRTLGLSRTANDALLCLIELLALRSGHAYQAAHLHHHARFPHTDDIEGAAARRSPGWGAHLAEGFVFQFRIWFWAVRNAKAGQGRGSSGRARPVSPWRSFLAAAALPVTPVPLVYAALMVMGSWVIPLATSWVPHDPRGEGASSFRRGHSGARSPRRSRLGHLYHLEHHLYPSVPHHHWPKLARRLDPYFKTAGVRPVRFWF